MTTTPTLILVAEDDPDTSLSLRTVLERAGHQVTCTADGREAVALHHAHQPDLVILDINLPGLDGWAALRQIRDRRGTPVLILTAREVETDKVRALQSGADDYLTKPFSVSELTSRVSAILRRARYAPAAPEPAHNLELDDGLVRIPGTGPGVTVGGRAVELTRTEVRLLTVLVTNAGHVLSPDQLLASVWLDPTGTGVGRLRSAMANIRRKCGWVGTAHCPIETVRGFGYRYSRPQHVREHLAGAPLDGRRDR